jgi:hypothetical protein
MSCNGNNYFRTQLSGSYQTAIIGSCVSLHSINHVEGLMLFCFMQGTKIIDESEDQNTTDLHKCVAYIRDLTPDTDKSEVS